MNDLEPSDDDNLPAMEQCIVLDGDRLHFTQVGLARFRERFARAGIDIRNVTSGEQLMQALEASFRAYWEREVARIAATKPRSHREGIERAYVVAIALGDKGQTTRLEAILTRLNTHPLSLVRTPEPRST